MSIAITTLNNEAAAAQTMTLLGRDLNSAKWYNATAETATVHGRLTIKQSLTPATKNALLTRRTLVQYNLVKSVDGAGAPLAIPDQLTVNVTIVKPEFMQVLGTTAVHDCVAVLRNLLTASVVTQLIAGEV